MGPIVNRRGGPAAWPNTIRRTCSTPLGAQAMTCSGNCRPTGTTGDPGEVILSPHYTTAYTDPAQPTTRSRSQKTTRRGARNAWNWGGVTCGGNKITGNRDLRSRHKINCVWCLAVLLYPGSSTYTQTDTQEVPYIMNVIARIPTPQHTPQRKRSKNKNNPRHRRAEQPQTITYGNGWGRSLFNGDHGNTMNDEV